MEYLLNYLVDEQQFIIAVRSTPYFVRNKATHPPSNPIFSKPIISKLPMPRVVQVQGFPQLSHSLSLHLRLPRHHQPEPHSQPWPRTKARHCYQQQQQRRPITNYGYHQAKALIYSQRGPPSSVLSYAIPPPNTPTTHEANKTILIASKIYTAYTRTPSPRRTRPS